MLEIRPQPDLTVTTEPMGGGKNPPVSIRIHPDLLAFVDREAARTFRSRNAYIRELLVREYEAARVANAR